MAIIISIDYGIVRTGIAATDPLQIIASPLITVPTEELKLFLKSFISSHSVESILIGQPYDLKGNLNPVEEEIEKVIDWIKHEYANLSIIRMDERFSSAISKRALLQSGIGKTKRRDKALLDKMSACLLLQDYLELKR